MSIVKILAASLLIFKYVQGNPRVDPLVDTKLGLIRGLRASEGAYSMFMGIPYAKVDEANPFGPSTPYPKFEDVFEAYDDSAICPQIEEFNNTIVGSLDCLHLNVYVPNTASSNNRLPVLVWIYGGGFSIGFAGRYLYGPKYLVKHDVILVTLNYRLGPYGFMCLDTPEVPGNQGLKDQQLALRWINDNIESFGGDVDKITIFGESAGSMSVDLHLLSDERKLFSNIIMESGTASLAYMISEPDSTTPIKLAEKLGFATDDASKALSFISTIDPKLVIAAASTMDRFFPCVEKVFNGVESFLTEFPVNKNIPKAKGIHILIGFNNNEQIHIYGNAVSEYFESLNIFESTLKNGFQFNDKELNEMETLVRHFYIGDEKISESVKFEITDFDSDFTFNHPTERSITKYVQNGAEKIFYYVFAYSGGRNFVKRKNNINVGGAAHADEIGYLFDIASWTEEPTPEDQLILDRVTMMWTNFVKYGDPTPETTELLPVKWEPITDGSVHHYLNIDSELTIGARPFCDRMAFWDLFYKLNEKLQKGYTDQ